MSKTKKTTTSPNTLTVEERAKYVEAVKKTWWAIAHDILQSVAESTGEDYPEIDGSEAREVVADYITTHGGIATKEWYEVPSEIREAIILEALPENSWTL